ncbi:MAG: radical SAM protein [Candidatus Lokiarchaeota archaeon]|nr:radical SAM protein [Candidatus Lokiarchaeota archaeon]MBD3202239.1 radical SAM protein [Candidatus Lokiarchaeota archaeon]
MKSPKLKDKCEICKEELIYAINSKDYKTIECEFCKNPFNANIYCPNGHYICDDCHSKEPIKVIENFCSNTDLKDPFIISEKIMIHPKFKMYGPEHHVLSAAAILAALKNNDVKKPNGKEITEFDIKEAIRRASKIPGGWCGFYGSCGAGMGSGVAISIFTNATPSKDKPRSYANQMTSRSLNRIADNMEHCCKRSVRLTIMEAFCFLKEKFGIDLNYSPQKCSFSDLNDKCVGKQCPIF